MSKGPKQITRGEVFELAKDAEALLKSEQKIDDSFLELSPIFDVFIQADRQCRHCFEYLVEKGIVKQSQKKSFSNAFAKYKNKPQHEQTDEQK